MTDNELIDDLLGFWFGELDDNGLCSDDRHSRWFGADKETDAACRSRSVNWLTDR